VRGLVKVVVGIGAPLAIIVALLISLGPRPGDPPPPVALRTHAPTGEDRLELVGSLDGEWHVRPEESFLGYRITEQYSRLYRPTEAAGRTPQVEGALTVTDAAISSVEIRGDLRELTSDQDNRDRVIRRRYLESERFPHTTFVLTEPIPLAGLATANGPFIAEAVGDLTVRDVTRRVAFSVEARLAGVSAEVVGVLDIRLTDFEVEPPDIPGYVTVSDDATIELSLVFDRVRAAP
jgi:polyisoprenoid-binding protein YceI